MRTLPLVVVACLWAGQAAARSPAFDWTAYSLANERSIPGKLALCDTSAFLATRPNLNAEEIYVPRPLQPQRLLGPYFLGGGLLYGERYERLRAVLRAKRLLDNRAVAEAQNRISRPMIAQARLRPPPQAFLDAQLRSCSGFGQLYGVNVG